MKRSLLFGTIWLLSIAPFSLSAGLELGASGSIAYNTAKPADEFIPAEAPSRSIDVIGEAESLGWKTDFDAVLDRARRVDRPVVAMFTSDWAPPVAATVRETLSDPKVRHALRSVETVVLDVDLDAERADEMKIDQLPTFVVFDSHGEEYDRFSGFLPPGAFVPTFQAAIDPKQAIPELIARIEQDPRALRARWQLAKKYARDKKAEELADVLDDLRDADPGNREGYLDNVAYMELMTTLDPRMPRDGVLAAARFLDEFPKSEFAPEIELTLAHLYYQMDEKDRCFEIMEDFPRRYPDSPLASQVAKDLRELRGDR